MKKILVVDDEADIRKMLKEYMELEGYFVMTAANALEAEKLLRQQPDLMLLDISMPETDGISFCEKIRDSLGIPIIFLSARMQEGDKISGLRAGGDDYITKPFSMEELLARMEAHLRREERGKSKKQIWEKDLLVDFEGYRILKEEKNLNLTKMEFQIAELLITNKGQTFSKERIYENVRGYDGEGDAGVVTEHIRRIRKKMGCFEGKEYIETVWGMGYRWIG